MPHYKILNITNTLGKRDPKFNTSVDVEYNESLIIKKIKIKPMDCTYITIPEISTSMHRLRMMGLITIQEIKKNELIDAKNNELFKKNTQVIKNSITDEKKSTKKRTYKEDNEIYS